MFRDLGLDCPVCLPAYQVTYRPRQANFSPITVILNQDNKPSLYPHYVRRVVLSILGKSFEFGIKVHLNWSHFYPPRTFSEHTPLLPCLSSGLITVSSENLYWNPEHPPPSTSSLRNSDPSVISRSLWTQLSVRCTSPSPASGLEDDVSRRV